MRLELLAVACGLALAASAASARAAGPRPTITIESGEFLLISGTRVACLVATPAGRPLTVTCTLVNRSTLQPLARTFSIQLSDAEVRVVFERDRKLHLAFGRRQPRAAGPTYSRTAGVRRPFHLLRLGQTAAIAGTHVACAVSAARFVSCVVRNGSRPVDGSYSVGMSDSFVQVARIEKGKFRRVYAHETLVR